MLVLSGARHTRRRRAPYAAAVAAQLQTELAAPVKGWIAATGEAQERVYDAAWSGEERLLPDGSLAAVGSSVDLKTGLTANGIGSPRLTVVWQDPEFDPAQSAFYYARVLQIPTARHSLLDKLALGDEDMDTRRPDTIQERAYTSPIWYRP